jgi:phosphatidylglycerol:prolipoprotein diacylglycerol transferase
MWYGILVAAGIALAVFLLCKRAPKHDITEDNALNCAIVIVIAGIVGARLYYVIFNWQYYGKDLSSIFNVREGGLAIHGGLLFGALAAVIVCRFWKERPLNLLDLFFVSVPLGQAIGRWGNYFNSEAHGGPTTLPWGVMVDGVKVHPTFLYESIWCLLLFLFLLWIDNRRKFEGQTVLLYCILYSFERFLVEGLRTDSLMLFGTWKQAKVLSVIAFFGAAVFYVLLSRKAAKKAQVESAEPVRVVLTEEESGEDGETAGVSFTTELGEQPVEFREAPNAEDLVLPDKPDPTSVAITSADSEEEEVVTKSTYSVSGIQEDIISVDEIDDVVSEPVADTTEKEKPK